MIGTSKITDFKQPEFLKIQLKCHTLQSKVLEGSLFPNHKHQIKKS